MQLINFNFIILVFVTIMTISANVVHSAGSKPRLPQHKQLGIRIKGHGVNRHVLPRHGGGHIEL